MLKNLFSIFRKDSEPRGYPIYVVCDRCGEYLTTRIDKANDLSIEYGDNPRQDTYFCRKLLVGERPCYEKIEVELTFDDNKKLVEKTIQGGSFITEETYLERMEEE